MRRATLLALLTLLSLAACDNASDAAQECPPCPLGSVCVQRFDGTCGMGAPSCVTTTESCPPNTCSAECQQALCTSPYQCQARPPCGSEATGAFTCYGP